MTKINSVIDVFTLLEKNNCRECGEKTCMAFAASVFMGKKQLSECPHLSPETVAKYTTKEKRVSALEKEYEKIIGDLKMKLRDVDLETRADRIGGVYENERLTLKILGKDFSIDSQGNAYTFLHLNSWIYFTSLSYIIHCQGTPISKKWVPLRELPSGKDWYRLFGQQCETVLKKTADAYPDLFSDLVHIFSGKQIDEMFDSDIAVILTPLPLVPILICYWNPEEGMGSSLNLFFDATAESNLGIDGVYQLGTGIAIMLEKLTRQHSGNR